MEFEVRRLIGQPDPLNSRFTPGVIQSFLNQAVWQVAFDTDDLKQEFDDYTTIGMDEFVLPENTIAVSWITINGRKLEKREQSWLHEKFPRWPTHGSSTTLYYYPRRTQDKLSSVGFYPTPSEANLLIRVCASVIPSRTFNPVDEPPIRKAFHPLLIPLTCSLCMREMRDAQQEAIYKNDYVAALGKLLNITNNQGSDAPLAFTPADPLDNGLNFTPWSWI